MCFLRLSEHFQHAKFNYVSMGVGGLRFTPQTSISMGSGMTFPDFLIISLKNIYRSQNTENAKLVYLFKSSNSKPDIALNVSHSFIW